MLSVHNMSSAVSKILILKSEDSCYDVLSLLVPHDPAL